MAEWKAAKVTPGAGGLYCQGNCKCRLEKTTDAAGGVLKDVPVRKEKPVKNSGTGGRADGETVANVGWTDEARAASLEVRRAKAAARETGSEVARAAAQQERQKGLMDRASKDYAAIYEKKGHAGMSAEERKSLGVRISMRARNGSALTPTEARFVKEDAQAAVDQAKRDKRKAQC
jgi:hypothetical protein